MTASASPRPVWVLEIAGLTEAALHEVPRLRALGDAGVVRPLGALLPGLTGPLQATIATGVGPDRHGVVSEAAIVPEIDAVAFGAGVGAAVQAEPIWTRIARRRPGFR